jgi:hypothetical protein
MSTFIFLNTCEDGFATDIRNIGDLQHTNKTPYSPMQLALTAE